MRFTIIFLALFFSFTRPEANNIQVLKDGPIHEAFVQQEFGDVILQAISDKPPPPITEEIPRSIDDKLLWISGYWGWSRDANDYIWISGVWRHPPPGHQWVEGHWKNYRYGWVWMSGFWSKIPVSEIEYLSQPPPDLINEKVPMPPLSEEAYFWVPGYWEWQPESEEYRWLSGRWNILEQPFLYVPAQYFWREDGYIFVPGFWDWPIEERGIAFANVSIPAEERALLVFEPSVALNPLHIMERLFPYWPSYSILFYYHFYYHYNLWASWGAFPPWWQWRTWWSLSIQDSWWLWWWWSHPGYPNPSWIDSELAKKIAPPSDLSLKIMETIQPPAIVTANGVIGSKQLIEAIEKATGKKNPILSSDPKEVEQVQHLTDSKVLKPPFLRPEGEKKIDKIPPKPNINSSTSTLKLHPGRVKLPLLPPEEHQIVIEPKPVSQIEPVKPAERYEAPIQGYQPKYQYPQIQMQTQHLDHLMTKPQPQENPAGPKVHQSPGDESTLPDY